MATGTVRTADYLVNTSFAANTSGQIGNDDVQDAAETGAAMPFTTQTVSYTATITDRGTLVEMNSASALNFTVPPNSSVAFPLGSVLYACQLGAGQVTVVAGSGVTIRTPASLLTRAQYSTLSLRKRATDEWVISGDLA